MIDRASIYAALFALIETTPGFTKTSQRLEFPSSDSEQPALYLRRCDDEYLPREGRWGPAKVILNCELIIYYRTTDVNEPPGIELDVLIGNAEAQLAPVGTAEVQTLGGLVQRLWIEGTIKKDDGALYGQAGAIIPVKILTTS
jgi:hypothetical protein